MPAGHDQDWGRIGQYFPHTKVQSSVLRDLAACLERAAIFFFFGDLYVTPAAPLPEGDAQNSMLDKSSGIALPVLTSAL